VTSADDAFPSADAILAAAVALLAPGVGQDILPNGQTGLRVYGASSTENNYVVDGINTTNAEFGTQGKKIPVEFIKEFQVKTGGYEAEFGKSTGITLEDAKKLVGPDCAYHLYSTANDQNGETTTGDPPIPEVPGD